MKSHAEVHEEVERICAGTRLQTFMVTTTSIRHEDGSVAVEWAVTISSGRVPPELFFRARDPSLLLEDVRVGVQHRRTFFAIRELDTLRGVAPKDTALPDPLAAPLPDPAPRRYDPTGQF